MVTTKGKPVKNTVLPSVSFCVELVLLRRQTYPRVAATTLLDMSLVGKRGSIFMLASLGVRTCSHMPKARKQITDPTSINTTNKLRQEK